MGFPTGIGSQSWSQGRHGNPGKDRDGMQRKANPLRFILRILHGKLEKTGQRDTGHLPFDGVFLSQEDEGPVPAKHSYIDLWRLVCTAGQKS